MSEFLIDLLTPSRLTEVVDIGANPIDGDPPYKPMLERRLSRVTGFEPQQSALAALNARKSDLESYLPYVVGDGGRGRLHICREPGMTSLLQPDQNILRHFGGFPVWGEVVGEEDMQTRRLDDIEEIAEMDFLKIDVQGSELSIFQSGKSKLQNAVVVQTEVSFITLYKDQPCFGDIDIELRSQGFVPHAIFAQRRRVIGPMSSDNIFAGINQIIEADVVYVRDFFNPDKLTSEQLKHLAIVAHYCYGSFDLAANCLYHLAARREIEGQGLAHYVKNATAYKVHLPEKV